MYEMNVDKLDLLLYSIFYNLLFSIGVIIRQSISGDFCVLCV